MRYLKTYKIFESWSNDILPVGTKIKFDGKDCEIIDHKSNFHNDIFYLIRYLNGQEEFVTHKDKRIKKVSTSF